MKTYSVHDKAIVIVLTKKEAKSLMVRLGQHTGIRESMAVRMAKAKIRHAIEIEEP